MIRYTNKKSEWKQFFIMKSTCFILAGLLVMQGCSNNNKIHAIYEANKIEEKYETVRLKELLQNPGLYKNHIIETIGIYKSEIEESSVYPDKSSFKEGKNNTALWVSFNKDLPLIKNKTGINLLDSYQEFEKIGGRKIKIRGKFNPDSKGHLSMFFGSIENVFYIEVLD